MSRIRSIKPEFPQSESIGRLSRDARLLFILLWTISDDFGRARASSRVLAGTLYPFDDDARGLMDGWLDELEQQGCIRRYEVHGTHYLDIPNWLKHQKIDHPSKIGLPEFRESLASPREPLAPDLGSRTLDLGKKDCSMEPHQHLNGVHLNSENFESFWQAYPKKVAKKEAKKAYEKAIKETAAETILRAVERQKPQWRDPKYIPYPATWLNRGHWQDELAGDDSSWRGLV